MIKTYHCAAYIGVGAAGYIHQFSVSDIEGDEVLNKAFTHFCANANEYKRKYGDDVKITAICCDGIIIYGKRDCENKNTN